MMLAGARKGGRALCGGIGGRAFPPGRKQSRPGGATPGGPASVLPCPPAAAPQNPRGRRLGYVPQVPFESPQERFPFVPTVPSFSPQPTQTGLLFPLPWEGPGHPCTPGPGVGQGKGGGKLPCCVRVLSCKALGPAWGLGGLQASDGGPGIPTPARLPAPPARLSAIRGCRVAAGAGGGQTSLAICFQKRTRGKAPIMATADRHGRGSAEGRLVQERGRVACCCSVWASSWPPWGPEERPGAPSPPRVRL